MVHAALFYALAAAMLGFAAVTVLARNLFRAALGLLGVLWCTAILFVALRAEMVALVQVMVYIGGIMIFVLYAVLLTSELGGRMAGPSTFKAGGALVAAGTAAAVIAGFAKRAGVTDTLRSGNVAALKSLGVRLLDPGPLGFLVPFELISVLLLAAMVGAIAVARGPGQGRAVPGPDRAAAGKGGA